MKEVEQHEPMKHRAKQNKEKIIFARTITLFNEEQMGDCHSNNILCVAMFAKNALEKMKDMDSHHILVYPSIKLSEKFQNFPYVSFSQNTEKNS